VTSFAQVERFIERSKRTGTPRELDNLLASVTAEMGFDYYALIHHVDLTAMNTRELTHMADGSLVALTNYPEGWVEAYVARNIVVNDPVHLASHRTNVGFRWDEVDRLIPVTTEHRAIRDDTLRAGIDAGYTVPANVPGEANGSCSFAMRRGASLPEQNLAMAQLVGSFAFQAARTLVLGAKHKAAAAEPAPLSHRQLECVLLVGRGKTDWEIGKILGISEETVKHHLKQAREHYDVPKRVQVVMRAVYEGQIALTDLLR
jgi:LuxR family transcriptional regulator, quorum-sensing system regulator CciR